MKKTVRIYHIQDYICTPGTGCVCEFWEGESPLHVHGDFYEISLITAGNFENIYAPASKSGPLPSPSANISYTRIPSLCGYLIDGFIVEIAPD